MNKSYVVSNNKLIIIDEKGETDVLDNTKSNLKKKQLENDLRKLKEKLEENKNDFIKIDFDTKFTALIAIVISIVTFATCGSGILISNIILAIIGIILILIALKKDDKRELIKKNIKCIKEMIAYTRNEYMKEHIQQKTLQQINNYEGCTTVQKFCDGIAISKTEQFLMLISLYEMDKKKFLKYYRKNRSLKGLNFNSEEERIFLERVILCDLGIEDNYIDVPENNHSLIKR